MTVAEPTVRVAVEVTFLRLDVAPAPPGAPAPDVVRVGAPTVGFYRYLYDTVGAPYLWWLRRAMPDPQLAALLADPLVSLHVLYIQGEPAGFYELDGRAWPEVNLSYFGLLPHALGQGLGPRLLRHAVAQGWAREGVRAMTVNTCTADHPRALPTYLRAGFRIVRRVPELWQVPVRLGLQVPPSLRA